MFSTGTASSGSAGSISFNTGGRQSAIVITGGQNEVGTKNQMERIILKTTFILVLFCGGRI